MKSLNEILKCFEDLKYQNKVFIPNNVKCWLDFAKNRIMRLYGLSEKEIGKYYMNNYNEFTEL